MGRPAQPEELAPTYVFLASEADSSYITGTVLQVMGGETTGGQGGTTRANRRNRGEKREHHALPELAPGLLTAGIRVDLPSSECDCEESVTRQLLALRRRRTRGS